MTPSKQPNNIQPLSASEIEQLRALLAKWHGQPSGRHLLQVTALGTILGPVVLALGGIFWAGQIQAQVEANSRAIEANGKAIEANNQKLTSLSNQVDRNSGKLDVLVEQSKPID